MAETPRTSFLLPMYQAAATIEDAVRSALSQTDEDLEVVVVDDGSTDGSADRVQSIGDRRVRVLRRPHEGIVSALQHGLAACHGRWIARLDADDIAAPERLEMQLPWLMADDRLAVVDGRVRFFRDNGPVPGGMEKYAAWINDVCTPDAFDRELLIESPIVHPAATMRASAVKELGGYRAGPFPEDYDLWLRLHAAGWRLRKVPHELVAMRDRPERLTRTDARYTTAAFDRARRTWLTSGPLSTPRRVAVWGAGRTGKRWLRWLLSQGHEVPAIVDPFCSGNRRAIPVVAPDTLPSLQVDLLLAAVGVPSARPLIRSQVAALRPEWTEGRDWWHVA